MANREEVLRDETHKGDVASVGERVFYTLKEKASQAHRNSKAIALLVEHLHNKKLISDVELDELLLKVVDRL